MIKTARLSIAYGKHTDNDLGMEQVFDAAMERAGVTEADIWINAGDDYGLNTHFGNWCVVPVRDNDAAVRLAKEFGTELDLHNAILEASDVAQFMAFIRRFFLLATPLLAHRRSITSVPS